MTERTLVLIKPDGVARGLIGEVLTRIERRGYRLVAAELRTLDGDTARTHYRELSEKPFFESLISFITSGPLLAAVVEGPEIISVWRAMIGKTNPLVADPGTIRGDLASDPEANVVHGSDSPESATREIALFFPGLA